MPTDHSHMAKFRGRRRRLDPESNAGSTDATMSQDKAAMPTELEVDGMTRPQERAVSESHASTEHDSGSSDGIPPYIPVSNSIECIEESPKALTFGSRGNEDTQQTGDRSHEIGTDSLHSPRSAESSHETNVLAPDEHAKLKAKTQAAMLKMLNDLNDAKNSFIKGVGQSVKAAADAKEEVSFTSTRSEGLPLDHGGQRPVAEEVVSQYEDKSGLTPSVPRSTLERPQNAPDQSRSYGEERRGDYEVESVTSGRLEETISQPIEGFQGIGGFHGEGAVDIQIVGTQFEYPEIVWEGDETSRIKKSRDILRHLYEYQRLDSLYRLMDATSPKSSDELSNKLAPLDSEDSGFADITDDQVRSDVSNDGSKNLEAEQPYNNLLARSTTSAKAEYDETDTLPGNHEFSAAQPWGLYGLAVPLQSSRSSCAPTGEKSNSQPFFYSKDDFKPGNTIYGARDSLALSSTTYRERLNDAERYISDYPQEIDLTRSKYKNAHASVRDTQESSGIGSDAQNQSMKEQSAIAHADAFANRLLELSLQPKYPWHFRSPESDRQSDWESDRASVISQTNSIWSLASLNSTATGITTASGYSAAQIETATKELLHIFLENEYLASLYGAAINRARIGPDRLQRNIRRLLKRFAQDLQAEADKELEKLAARLVSLKAAYVARTVIEKYEARSLPIVAGSLRPLQHSSQQDDASSEEEGEDDDPGEHVDEDLIKDLPAFRQFLAEGQAFIQFQRDLEAFVLPRPVEVRGSLDTMELTIIQEPNVDMEADRSTEFEDKASVEENHQSVLSKTRMVFTSLLITAGFLEPPLELGMVRVRWVCKCSKKFFGDVKEFHRDGVKELIAKMRRSTGATVTVTTYSATSTNQKWTFSSPAWLKRLSISTSSSQIGASGRTGCLPQHNDPSQSLSSTITTPVVGLPVDPKPTLHLLACAHRNQQRKYLLQDPIDAVSTDRELFCFMKQQLKRNYRRIRSFLSMRSVQGIFFIKFRLRRGNIVEVRDHHPCCTSTTPKTCECIPPAAKVEPSPNAEYRCTPAGPLATWPPVLSKDLMHMLLSPECVDEQETWVLDQLPKRTVGKLEEKRGPPVEGWGIYYEEGIDWDWVISIVFSIFLLASLLFGILWTKLEMDIQGAFGVSSYMVASSGITMAWLASRAKNFG